MTQASKVSLWSAYDGLLYSDPIGAPFRTSLFAFLNRENSERPIFFDSEATYFGCVERGSMVCRNSDIEWKVSAQQWFSIPKGFAAHFLEDTRAVVLARHGYQGLYSMGGPLEKTGRLRYIDGCSDTLLCAPPRQGDPCLNLLHFPTQVNQTAHTHPSSRMGIVMGGSGFCHEGGGKTPLNPGDVFHIPANSVHHFSTENSFLNVFAYHPDSDWGPQDEDHPMINRTWVGGKKIRLAEPSFAM